ncbi:DUF1080 domain-containing protein [Compostibacter hankyongensis]|uniref:DUF1080 domain-containing protein n=1 Tax=Compostibacter hankyongensis TaxID=1007089 RepID=A0ABP8FK76_9BACT
MLKRYVKHIPLAFGLAALVLGGCNSAGNNGAAGDADSSGAGDSAAGAAESGFVSLFDGQTLNGWKGDTAVWRAENGEIIGEVTESSTPLKANSFLIWQGGTPGDFELTAEFKLSPESNSGIQYRSDEVDGVPFALKGYQADMDGANNYTGQNYEERKRTTLAYRGQKTTLPPYGGGDLRSGIKNNAWTAAVVDGSLGSSDSLKTLIKADDWNTCRIVAKGNHLQHYINGVLMSDVTDNDTVNGKTSGLIGIQIHAGHPMKVEYRNIMLKQD